MEIGAPYMQTTSEKENLAQAAIKMAACAGMVLAIIQYILPSALTLYWLNTTYLGLLGAAALIRCISSPGTSSAAMLLGATYGLAYGLGTLNTEIRSIENFNDIVKMTFTNREYISQAISLVLFTSSLLIFIGAIIRAPLMTRESFLSQTPREVLLTSGMVALAAAAMVATGKIRFNYDIGNEEGGISAVGQIVLISLCPAVGLIAANLQRFDRRERLAAIFFAGILLLIQLMMARRLFAFTLVTAILCHFSTNQNKSIFSFKNIAIAIVIGLTLSAASKAFVSMRLASQTMPKGSSISQTVPEAFRIIKNPERSGINSVVSENEETRTFVIGYLALLLERVESSPPLYGELAQFTAAIITPSAIWPGKYRYSSLGFEEAISHPHFGLPIWDAANSLFTSGLSDFGPAGAVLYPLIIGIFYSIITRIANNQSAILPTTPLLISICLTTLGAETGIASYFITIRDSIILCIAFAAIIHISRKMQSWNRTDAMNARPPVRSQSAKVQK